MLMPTLKDCLDNGMVPAPAPTRKSSQFEKMTRRQLVLVVNLITQKIVIVMMKAM